MHACNSEILIASPFFISNLRLPSRRNYRKPGNVSGAHRNLQAGTPCAFTDELRDTGKFCCISTMMKKHFEKQVKQNQLALTSEEATKFMMLNVVVREQFVAHLIKTIKEDNAGRRSAQFFAQDVLSNAQIHLHKQADRKSRGYLKDSVVHIGHAHFEAHRHRTTIHEIQVMTL